MEAQFAFLRELLCEPASPELWDFIYELFQQWSDKESFLLAIDYADLHMQQWPDEFRTIKLVVHKTFALPSVWPLVRELEISTSNTYFSYDIELPKNIKKCRFVECDNLQELSLYPLCRHITELDLLEAPKLEYTEGLTNLQQLETLKFGQYPKKNTLAELKHLSQLKRFEGSFRNKTNNLNFLQHLPELQSLKASMYHVSSLQSINACPEIEEAQIEGSLYEHPEELTITRCPKLTKLILPGSMDRLLQPPILHLHGSNKNIKSIDFGDFSPSKETLATLAANSYCKSSLRLNWDDENQVSLFSSVQGIEEISCFTTSTNIYFPLCQAQQELKKLTIFDSQNLQEITGLEQFETLSSIFLSYCWNLESLLVPSSVHTLRILCSNNLYAHNIQFEAPENILCLELSENYNFFPDANSIDDFFVVFRNLQHLSIQGVRGGHPFMSYVAVLLQLEHLETVTKEGRTWYGKRDLEQFFAEVMEGYHI